MSFCSHVRSMEMQTITRVKPGPPPTRGRGSSRVGNPPGLIYVIMNVVLGTGATYATYAEPKCECSPARWVSTTTTKCAILTIDQRPGYNAQSRGTSIIVENAHETRAVRGTACDADGNRNTATYALAPQQDILLVPMGGP